ncbi:MAG TPA: hypothetical protein EYO59_01410 [Chromatiaceae bacterium]|nr:hypothetical protein [Chromatiaceae bacterium]
MIKKETTIKLTLSELELDTIRRLIEDPLSYSREFNPYPLSGMIDDITRGIFQRIIEDVDDGYTVPAEYSLENDEPYYFDWTAEEDVESFLRRVSSKKVK